MCLCLQCQLTRASEQQRKWLPGAAQTDQIVKKCQRLPDETIGNVIQRRAEKQNLLLQTRGRERQNQALVKAHQKSSMSRGHNYPPREVCTKKKGERNLSNFVKKFKQLSNTRLILEQCDKVSRRIS